MEVSTQKSTMIDNARIKSIINLSNLGYLIGIFAIFIFNFMRISDLNDYIISLPLKISYRTQLLYNVTKQNLSLNLDFGTLNLGNFYTVMYLLILLIPVVYLVVIILVMTKPNSTRSQYILKNFNLYNLTFIFLELLVTMKITSNLYIGDLFDQLVSFITSNFEFINNLFSEVTKGIVADIVNLFLLFPPILIIFLFGVIIYYFTRKNKSVTLISVIILSFINAMGWWSQSLETIGLILVATVFCLLTGIPLGIISAKSDTLYTFIRPVLDFMQTLPSFVYLIPAVFLFSIGNASGIVATYIFAMPPAVRLTNLGLRQVPIQLDEVAEAYGCTGWQKLVKVELPVAFPTIMAGVNQVIMLALSMVVIAAMIGSSGLGVPVVAALNQLNLKTGFSAGLAIVLIAMLLDRVTGTRQED